MPFSIAFCSDSSDPFFREVLAGVREEVDRSPQLDLRQWRESFTVPLPWVDVLEVDAVVAGACSRQSIEKRRGRFPLIGCSNALPEVSWPRILNDDVAAGRMAARALLEVGYPRLLGVFSEGGHNIAERLRGVEEQAAEQGIPLETWRISMRPPREGEAFEKVWTEHHRELRNRLRDLPDHTGIVLPTGAYAAEILDILRRDLQRNVPRDIGLVMADLPEDAERPLAHVRLSAREIGRRCTRQLLHTLEHPDREPPLSEKVAPGGISPGTTLRGDEIQTLLKKLDRWCRSHLREDLPVEDMARAVGHSRRSLEMKVREAGLPSPHQILIDYRLREARRLLETTPLRLEELAEACGFHSGRALSKRFSARHGLSPMQWRKQHRNPPP